MGDRDDGAGEGVQEALQPRHRLGVEVVGRLVQQQHVGLREQQPRTAPRAVARRRRGSMTSASPGGQRSASMAVSSMRSRFQPSAASIWSCTSPCSASSVFISSSDIGSANFMDSSVKRSMRSRMCADAVLDVAADVLGLVEFAAPAAGSRCAGPAPARRFAVRDLFDAGHDAQQRRLARAVERPARRSWRRGRRTARCLSGPACRSRRTCSPCTSCTRIQPLRVRVSARAAMSAVWPERPAMICPW